MAYRELHKRLGIASDYGHTPYRPFIPEASELCDVGPDVLGRPQRLSSLAAKHWLQMRSSAKKEGVQLDLLSGFRSFAYQSTLIEKKLASGLALDSILQVNAAPGFSQHHSGDALDVTTTHCNHLSEEFELTPAFKWLSVHGVNYGFYMPYPRDNSFEFIFEPWHWSLLRLKEV